MWRGGGYTEICWRGQPESSGEMWKESVYRTYFRGLSVDAVHVTRPLVLASSIHFTHPRTAPTSTIALHYKSNKRQRTQVGFSPSATETSVTDGFFDCTSVSAVLESILVLSSLEQKQIRLIKYDRER